MTDGKMNQSIAKVSESSTTQSYTQISMYNKTGCYLHDHPMLNYPDWLMLNKDSFCKKEQCKWWADITKIQRKWVTHQHKKKTLLGKIPLTSLFKIWLLRFKKEKKKRKICSFLYHLIISITKKHLTRSSMKWRRRQIRERMKEEERTGKGGKGVI